MNEIPEEKTAQPEGGPMAGQRLAAARRAQNVSVLEIAKELHLDEYKIHALESNEFAVLGAPVFAKGHLRKYAELVGVPIDDVLADYYKLNRAQPVPPIVGRPRRRERDLQLGPWLAGIAVVAIVGGAGYWWTGRPVTPPDPDAGTASRVQTLSPRNDAAAGGATGEPAPNGNPAASGPPDQPAVEAAEPGPADADAAASGATAPADLEPAPAADPAAVSLTLEFSGDCWTEVTNANGERLFFDLGTAGRRVSVRGPAPLRVLVGSSDNVALSVDGLPFTIPDSARRGQTAKLSISKP